MYHLFISTVSLSIILLLTKTGAQSIIELHRAKLVTKLHHTINQSPTTVSSVLQVQSQHVLHHTTDVNYTDG